MFGDMKTTGEGPRKWLLLMRFTQELEANSPSSDGGYQWKCFSRWHIH